MVDQELLDILVCPENKSPVKMVDAATLEKINSAISAGGVKNRAGESVTETIDGGLLREDGQFLYPIRDDIPIMLIDESIPMAQLGA
jgi:uncharacterized protein YbaR (Trm112 family)